MQRLNEVNPENNTELSCYPATLMDEYRALVKKELNGSITLDEAVRFQVVRDKINEIDRQRPRPDIWDIQRAKLREELTQLRVEIEALPTTNLSLECN